jgi:hypothetical protein
MTAPTLAPAFVPPADPLALATRRTAAALAELDGYGVDAVAAYLLARDHQGRRIDAYLCPIAVHLRAALGDLVPTVTVSVSRQSIGLYCQGRDVYLPTPAAVADFVDRFDFGHYPKLVAA